MRTLIRNQRYRMHPAGFTLLELLIVLAIILVIAGMVVPNLMGSRVQANISATMATIKSLEKAPVGTYAADHDGNYPDGTGQEAWNLMINPAPYRGRTYPPYIEEVPRDAWGNVIQYEWNSKTSSHSKKQGALKPALWSYGPNGQDDGGSGDDINNWVSLDAQANK